MKKLFLYFTPLLLAFAVMVAVNEYSRLTMDESLKSKEGPMKINSAAVMPETCTWHCFSNTLYCKQHHVEVLKRYFAFVDPLYFGMITVLMATGGYAFANVLFLVLLWPLFMSYLLVKSIRLQAKIKSLKKVYG